MNIYRNRNGHGFTLIELIICIAIIGILAAIVVGALSTGSTTKIGTGEKRGTIVKAATEGFFAPTHEAELIRGGMNGGSGGFGTTPFHFTFKESQASNVEAFMKSGAEVVVKYKRPFWVWSWQSGSGVFLTDIEPAPPNTAESLSGTKTVDNR